MSAGLTGCLSILLHLPLRLQSPGSGKAWGPQQFCPLHTFQESLVIFFLAVIQLPNLEEENAKITMIFWLHLVFLELFRMLFFLLFLDFLCRY